ncbi:hypothetical protein CJ010_06190 [Azoarcus sp. DD4]|nr:hypothetical protein CJ010_06190 [Azoarcus sp. DD4]
MNIAASALADAHRMASMALDNSLRASRWIERSTSWAEVCVSVRPGIDLLGRPRWIWPIVSGR